VLGTNAFARALDDFELDGLTLAVIGFIAGGIYGLVGYFVLGFLAYAGARAAGSTAPVVAPARARRVRGSAARAVARRRLAAAPRGLRRRRVRERGSDTGFGNHLFEALELAAIVWSLGLVVAGTRAYHGWSIGRAFPPRFRWLSARSSRSRVRTRALAVCDEVGDLADLRR
jgi:hypothetical protein